MKRTMIKRIGLFLSVVLVFTAISGNAEENKAGWLPKYTQRVYANLMPLTDVSYYSVPTSAENIEIDTEGVLIDETNNTVSLTSDVNSITLNVADPARLDAVAGWVYIWSLSFGNDELENYKIYRKNAAGKVSDVSSDREKYLKAYIDTYGYVPTIANEAVNTQWRNRYEGAINMLITWEMYFGYINAYDVIDEAYFPEGILYYTKGENHYLMFSDGTRAAVTGLSSDQSVMAIGFAALYAYQEGLSFDELKCYLLNADPEDPQIVHQEELTADEFEEYINRIINTVSFKTGQLEINDPLNQIV